MPPQTVSCAVSVCCSGPMAEWRPLTATWSGVPHSSLGKSEGRGSLGSGETDGVRQWQHDSQTLCAGEVQAVSTSSGVVACLDTVQSLSSRIYKHLARVSAQYCHELPIWFNPGLPSFLPVPWALGLACTGRCELVGSWKRIPAVEDQLFQSQLS